MGLSLKIELDNGRWYDKLVLNNGKSGDDAHDLIIEFYEDFMKIYGSIRNGTMARLRWMI